ncbi:MAG TPA: PKD domain-containing protein, partial [Ferruginibacter sp.]|nr:PKD domain-containing protein [Ferruginibacter sp.]
MKRIFTLVWLAIISLTFKATAQPGTNCNAEFSIQYLSNSNVKFNPAITEGLPLVQHAWNFGDGSPVSILVTPTHNYLLPGTYPVVHTLTRISPNGGQVCVVSFTRTVTITAGCNLLVNFSWTSTAANLLTLAFQNLSAPLSNTDSITWEFGDNTISHEVNPVHTYANAGTYNVCLVIKKTISPTVAPCIKYICKTVVIQTPCNLLANFSWAPTTSNPLTIAFTNLSTPLHPLDSIRWTFGDGSSSTAVNPVHTYNVPGTYTVCLRVQKNNNTGSAPCVREICKTIVVTTPCNLVVNFSSHPDTAHPLRIKFTNQSTPMHPTDSVRWTFGDGTSVSGLQGDPNVANPTHNYTTAGNYTVCLRVKKNINTSPVACVKEICKTIAVQQPCNFQPAFSWRLDSLNPKKVHFTNLTITPTAAAIATWYFGDGTTATSWNAVHEYAQPGRYYVCLKVQISNTCTRYSCDSVTIPVPLPPCNNQSNFSVLSTSANSQAFTFVPAFQGNGVQYTWTFGDGTGSHDMIATHHYAQPGTYTACLTVWRSANCASTTCKEVKVLQQYNCNNAQVSFSYQADPQVPNKIHFNAISSIPLIDQTWTITKLPATSGTAGVVLHQDNPTWIFQDTGYYRICLRAVTLGGCVREHCSIIHITQLANVCELQAYPNPATNLVNVNVTLANPGMIHA